MRFEKFPANEVFKDKKTLPDFIKHHPIFTGTITAPNRKGVEEPIKIKKIFPAIGLANFSEEMDVPQAFVDQKREGGWCWNFLQDISTQCNNAKNLVSTSSERTQFLAPLAERIAKKAKLNEVAQITAALSTLGEVCDPRSATAFHATNGVVCYTAGKIDLRLPHSILNADNQKVIYKAGRTIQSVYSDLREKAIEHGVKPANFIAIDNMETSKIFGKENVPNRKWQLVFSSDGPDGAWDILTMSMRGFKSCQRWDGEYPKCLVGSVLSRFVGIIYLTSGSSSEPHPVFGGGMGSKMFRRCVVRYAYNQETDSSCILLDKMYPSEDEGTLTTFIDAIKKKTQEHADKHNAKYPLAKPKKALEVFYSPRLGSKTKTIYLHNEDIGNKLSHRERSYQDTALRTRCELDAHMINSAQTDIESNVSRITLNLSTALSHVFEDIKFNNTSGAVDPTIKKMVETMGTSSPFSVISEQIVKNLLIGFNPDNDISEPGNSRSYHKQYVRALFQQREKQIFYSAPRIDAVIKSHSNYPYSQKALSTILNQVIGSFCKKELSSIIKGK